MNLLENNKNYYDQIISGILTSAEVGYYVDNQQVKSRLQAIELANYDTSKITYRWQENQFDSVNWTKEPKEPLEQLVDQHVIRIRDLYDHVSLCWSGGYDSWTILRAFVRNNIKIDELVIWAREWWNKDSLDLDCELAVSAANFVKAHWMPDIKITQIKWGDKDVLVSHYYKNKLDWIYNNGGQSKINQSSREILYNQNGQLKRTLDRPGRSIQINGIDKPRVDLRDGKWYSVRSDALLFQESNDWALEFWYLPDLYVKQTWMMIHWLETLEETSHEFVHQLQSHSLGDQLYRDWNLAIGRELPLYSFLQGHNVKNLLSGTNAGESKYLADNIRISNPEIYHCWKTGADHLETINAKIKSLGHHNSIMSKEYFVKPFESKAKPASIVQLV
jgi:hypothetical protein